MEKIRQALFIMIACICGIVMLAGCDDDTNQTASTPTESATETTLTEAISESTTDGENETEAKSTEKSTEGKAETSTEKKAETTTAEKTTSKGEGSTEEPRHQATTTTEPARGQSETQTPVATKESAQTTTKATTAATRQTTVTTVPPQTQPPQTQTQPTETQPPPPAFDQNTHAWPAIDYNNVDANMNNYTVDGTLYLGQMVRKLNAEFTNGYEDYVSDLTECSISNSSIYIHRLIVSNITNDATMDYEFWYSAHEYSRFTPHFVRNNCLYEYRFDGSSNDLIRVDINGQTAEFSRNEMRVLVRAMTGAFAGISDALVEFGYTVTYYD